MLVFECIVVCIHLAFLVGQAVGTKTIARQSAARIIPSVFELRMELTVLVKAQKQRLS